MKYENLVMVLKQFLHFCPGKRFHFVDDVEHRADKMIKGLPAAEGLEGATATIVQEKNPSCMGVIPLEPFRKILPIRSTVWAEHHIPDDLMSLEELAVLFLFPLHDKVGVVAIVVEHETVFGIIDGGSLVSDLLAGSQQWRLIDALVGDRNLPVLRHDESIDVIPKLSG